MQSKSLLIAIAAFAVATTGIYGYTSPKVYARAGLTEEQVEALEEAQELRQAGDYTKARNRLAKAGITAEDLQALYQAAHSAKAAIFASLEAGDYEAFKAAIADSPLADIVTSEADFVQFKEAHELKLAEAPKNIASLSDAPVSDLREDAMRLRHSLITEFTADQQAALQVARQSNDRATIQAIFDEAGIEDHRHDKWR